MVVAIHYRLCAKVRLLLVKEYQCCKIEGYDKLLRMISNLKEKEEDNDDLEKGESGVIYNRRYRNRRIGDFLKELNMTEGRGTGIPIIRKEMKKNGSPEPSFETDDDYSYFITRLPINPIFLSGEPMNEPINEGAKNLQHTDNKNEKITPSFVRV